MLRALKRYFRKDLRVVALRLMSRGENPLDYIVKKNHTDICIDGYPRSANSFSVRMFRQSNPDSNIAHHTHAVANLSKSLVYGVPVVVLIRDPRQSIVSSVIAHRKNTISEEMHRYIDFYAWVLERVDCFVIADFDDVVNNFNMIIRSVNEKNNSSFLLLKDIDDADTKVKNDIEKRFDKLGQSKMSHIKPIPTKNRNEEKDRLTELVVGHDDFHQAQSLYDEITFLSKKS